VNFLLHRHLAQLAHDSTLAGLGAMLPDLWRMADRRVRPASPIEDAWDALGEGDHETHEVMRGIEHHLEVDLWFHEHDVFTTGEQRTAEALRGARTAAKKLVLFAHPLWEMCLDGALVRRLGGGPVRAAVAEAFTRGAPAARAAARAHSFARVKEDDRRLDAFEARMRWLGEELSSGPWIEGYARPDGLVRGLAGMRGRLGLPPFTDDERERLTEQVATLAAPADTALDEIFARA
jgi:acyl carrier protein phosphodiesterase